MILLHITYVNAAWAVRTHRTGTQLTRRNVLILANIKKYWTCSTTRLVVEQVLHFLT